MTLKVNLTLVVKGKVNVYYFFIVRFVDSFLRKFLTESIQIFNCGCWKKPSGWRGITSSIYLNWNISFIYYRFDIKLILVKEEWRWLLVRKNHFPMSLPVLQTWRPQILIANISLILRSIGTQFGQRDLSSPYDFLVI